MNQTTNTLRRKRDSYHEHELGRHNSSYFGRHVECTVADVPEQKAQLYVKHYY